MFRFIVGLVAVAVMVQARPGDITGAAETVDVPPEHRAAPPQAPQPQPPVQPYPVQPSFVNRGVGFPVAAGGVGPLFPPLFFQTQRAFVPYASTYSAYRVQHATSAQPAVILPQDPQPAAIVVA